MKSYLFFPLKSYCQFSLIEQTTKFFFTKSCCIFLSLNVFHIILSFVCVPHCDHILHPYFVENGTVHSNSCRRANTITACPCEFAGVFPPSLTWDDNNLQYRHYILIVIWDKTNTDKIIVKSSLFGSNLSFTLNSI